MKRLTIITLFSASLALVSCSQKTADERFIDNLMSQMTLNEKLGQLNLPVGGDIVSGTVKGTE